MNDWPKHFYTSFMNDDYKGFLREGKLGFEKESLRVNNSEISRLKHPKTLGSALCNQYITTDFSEAQLELITPPLSDKNQALQFLDDIHHFVSINIENETLWPFSVPPYIKSDEDIEIADYGSSNLGIFKKTYRNGLSNRYGRLMQAISGLHYNYSLPEKLWPYLMNGSNNDDLKTIKSEIYFHILRNLFRMNWLIIYLFGASPFITKNYIYTDKSSFKNIDQYTSYLPYATSLRMSDYGYCNTRRGKINISVNSLDDYIEDLNNTSKIESSDFLQINNLVSSLQPQLNANILQIEDEYYAIARAKSNNLSNKKPTMKLKRTGVDFIELRSLDLNPFSPIGIDKETTNFIELFFIYCLFKESKPISKSETDEISQNDLLVAKFGRDPKLFLKRNNKRVSLKEWGKKILDEMLEFTKFLDEESVNYPKILKSMELKVNNPEQTISGRLLDTILREKYSFIDLANSIAEKNKSYYSELARSNNTNFESLLKEVTNSEKKQILLERDTDESFEHFLEGYFKK